MDFVTSTLIGGMIYDVFKKGVFSSYEISKKVLSNFTQDENLYKKLEKILDHEGINVNSTLEDIVRKLESNQQTITIINNIQNIQNIHGHNNTINNYYENKKKKNFILEPVEERFRNFGVDFYFGFLTFFLGLSLLTVFRLPFLYSLLICIALISFYLFYLSRVFPIMYIDVYENRLVYLGNKNIMYEDIRNFRPHTNHFKFRLKQSAKYYNLILFNDDKAHFIDDAIRRYSIATNSLRE